RWCPRWRRRPGRRDIPRSASCSHQLSFENGDGLATQFHAVTSNPHPDRTTSRRRLVPEHFVLAQPRGPVWRESTVRGARHGVLVNAHSRCEEARDEVDTRGGGAAGDDHAADGEVAELPEVGWEGAAVPVPGDLDEESGLVLPDKMGTDAERGEQTRGRVVRRGGLGGEVELDPVATPVGGEYAGSGVKARGRVNRKMPVRPEHVRRGERRVAAQIDLGCRCEPAQVETVGTARKERGLR